MHEAASAAHSAKAAWHSATVDKIAKNARYHGM